MYPRHLPRAILLLCVACAAALPSSAMAKGRPHRTTPYVVVLDAGHGGSDSGATDESGTLLERSLTLQVASRAAVELKKKGYTVYVDRHRDQNVNTPPKDLNHDHKINKIDEYDARTLYANHHHADVFVSIHFDSSTSPDIHGTHGYYCPDRPFWKRSKLLATVLTYHVSNELNRAGYNSPDNGVQTDVADVVPQTRADYPWFLVLGPSRHNWITGSAMPGALIESLYLSSPQDVAALHRASTIKALGHGYATGIRAYFDGKTHR